MNILHKAVRLRIFKTKDLLIELGLLILLTLLISSCFFLEIFQAKAESEIILIAYTLIFAMGMIFGGAAVVSLTLKDKCSNRIEFFMAAKIALPELIAANSAEVFKLAAIAPLICFFAFYFSQDYSYEFFEITAFFLSTMAVVYNLIFILNLKSLYARKSKIYKNIIFLCTNLLILTVANFSTEICAALESLQIDLLYTIIALNLLISLILMITRRRELRKLSKERIIALKAEVI